MFPDTLNHDAMAAAVRQARSNTVEFNQAVRRTPVSAGFVSPEYDCYGHSFSLNLGSDHEADTALLHEQLSKSPPG